MIRVLCIADRPAPEPLDLLVECNGAELVLCLGDLGPFELPGLERVTVPKLGVHGNHCGHYFEAFGIADLHLRTGSFKGVRFGGFEGSHRYKPDGAYQYTQAEAEALLASFPPVDVLVCHSPPYGINDEPDELAHVGFHALRAYLDRARPRYLLHGHTDPCEAARIDRYRDTEIVYVHGVRLVELDL